MKHISRLFPESLQKPVRTIYVGCFDLVSHQDTQLQLFTDIERQKRLVTAVDSLNSKWGNFLIKPGNMLTAKNHVPDRVGFGRIRELDDAGYDGLQEW